MQSTLNMQSIVQGLGTCPPEYFLKNRYYEIETGGNFYKVLSIKIFQVQHMYNESFYYRAAGFETTMVFNHVIHS